MCGSELDQESAGFKQLRGREDENGYRRLRNGWTESCEDQGVNIRMIAQGSSELNILCVVEESGGVKAL